MLFCSRLITFLCSHSLQRRRKVTLTKANGYQRRHGRLGAQRVQESNKGVSLSPSSDRCFPLTHTVSLSLSGEYSDLIIACGPDTYKVHKAIVCSQSSFFSKAEKFPVCKVRQLASISARNDKISCALQVALLGDRIARESRLPLVSVCTFADWIGYRKPQRAEYIYPRTIRKL